MDVKILAITEGKFERLKKDRPYSCRARETYARLSQHERQRPKVSHQITTTNN